MSGVSENASKLSVTQSRPVQIAIVGGGLAGLAAAAALADSRLQRQSNGARLAIELFESRRMLGGRATSYRDPETGELIDNCQHVSLGCCTNFDDFCRRTGIDHLFAREKQLNFVGPGGRRHVVGRSRWLPAPLHLAPSLLRLSYLTLRERLSVAAALRGLAQCSNNGQAASLNFCQWLRGHGQSQRAIELFWSPVIVSALGEEVEKASLLACRKVFVDAFLRHSGGYELGIPRVALRAIYEEHVARWLENRAVRLHLGADVRTIDGTSEQVSGVLLANGASRPFDFVCLAVPWHRAAAILAEPLAARLSMLQELSRLDAAPITSVHLWCAKRLHLSCEHAVLPGRFSQWIFDRTGRGSCPYYQVVISASRQVASMSRDDVVARVCRDLEDALGEPIAENVTRARVLTEHKAVFSPTPESEDRRPSQKTIIPNLFLAGDWTATGWPATMESAVRSGYLAAESILARLGAMESILAPDLPAARLSRWLLGIR